MQRIQSLNPETTVGPSKELFDAIHAKLGMVPNMMRTMGNSPAVLNAYLGFNDALGKSSIGKKLGELIALTVANVNGCEYCNAAHSFIGEQLIGIDKETIENARQGSSTDPKEKAALKFARILVEKKGRVSSEDVDEVKTSGYTEAEITEIIAHTVLNIFTNHFNNALQVDVDFPESSLVKSIAV